MIFELTAGVVYDGRRGIETAQTSTTSLAANRPASPTWIARSSINGRSGPGRERPALRAGIRRAGDLRLGHSAEADEGERYYITVTSTDQYGLAVAATSPGVIVYPGPMAIKVGSTDPDGLYGPGSIISITVNYNVPVLVSGQPVLLLSDGAEATYILGERDRRPDVRGDGAQARRDHYGTPLDLNSCTPLVLNGGSITDLSGTYPASSTFPALGSPGSLGVDDDLVINAAITPVFLESIPAAVDTPINPEALTFSTQVAPNSLSWKELILTLDGGPNLITPAVQIVPFLGNTYEILGLAGLTVAEGSTCSHTTSKG